MENLLSVSPPLNIQVSYFGSLALEFSCTANNSVLLKNTYILVEELWAKIDFCQSLITKNLKQLELFYPVGFHKEIPCDSGVMTWKKILQRAEYSKTKTVTGVFLFATNHLHTPS